MAAASARNSVFSFLVSFTPWKPWGYSVGMNLVE
jgi:hypothetical protein